MKQLENIKQFFTPIQPQLNATFDQVEYIEHPPHPQLSHLIACYWNLKTLKPLQEDFTHRVVADGCIDIFWEKSNPETPFIMGFSSIHSEFSLTETFEYFGIRFLPTSFPILFKINAAELTNQFTQLEDLLPQLAQQLSNQSIENQFIEPLKDKLNLFFLQKTSSSSLKIDNRLFEAINIILQKKGNLNVQSDLNTGISPRQLRRLFQTHIGDSPKAFAKVVRFQNLLKSKPSTQSLKHNKIYYDLGYYDQSHFIKEFKHLYGLTPSEVLNNET